MGITLGFHGAARNVTGSRYVLTAGKTQVLVDCGLYQERKFKERNWAPFVVEPSKLDAVVLTHAHVDHCGLLPKLVKDGFSGPVYCTPATADIVRIILLDSAHIQTEDAAYKKRRHKKEGRTGPFPYEPLYDTQDAEAAIELLSPVKYEAVKKISGSMKVCFRDAGHILGSSVVQLDVSADGENRTIVFSGDVGRCDVPILRDPTQIEETDYLVVESTYGNRVHEDVEHIPDRLEKVINETCDAGGNIVIPSFAVERTQELLFHLSGLLREKRIPHLKAFVDSPMATRVTEVFRRHPELFDEDSLEMIQHGKHPCDFPGLALCRSVDESKAIKGVAGTSIIIAGSGMCTGGRIKHHLKNNIERPESTLLFVGYQAVGTLGRLLIDGKEEVRIHGKQFQVKARIDRIHGFSAHADKNELLTWMSSIKKAPRRVFVTHGEEEAALSFGDLIKAEKGWDTLVPEYGDEVELE